MREGAKNAGEYTYPPDNWGFDGDTELAGQVERTFRSLQGGMYGEEVAHGDIPPKLTNFRQLHVLIEDTRTVLNRIPRNNFKHNFKARRLLRRGLRGELEVTNGNFEEYAGKIATLERLHGHAVCFKALPGGKLMRVRRRLYVAGYDEQRDQAVKVETAILLGRCSESFVASYMWPSIPVPVGAFYEPSTVRPDRTKLVAAAMVEAHGLAWEDGTTTKPPSPDKRKRLWSPGFGFNPAPS